VRIMKKVEAILKVERLRIVKEHLKEIGIGGIIIHVSGLEQRKKTPFAV